MTSTEDKTSQGDSLNFIKSWNKKNLMKETLEVTSQNSNLGRLHMYAEVPQISSDNRSTWVQNFPTHQAKFFNLVPFDSMQTASSKCKNSDYSLDISLLSKSSIMIKNSDCHDINQKASLLAASSPAYFKAWSSFLTFCNLAGLLPPKTSSRHIVHWLNHEPDSSEPLRVLDN